MESSVTSDITWKCRTNNNYTDKEEPRWHSRAGTGFKPVTEGSPG